MKVIILVEAWVLDYRRNSKNTKPMVKIEIKPILVHIMNMYSKHGYRDFILALGYKQNIIKSYFKNKYHN